MENLFQTGLIWTAYVATIGILALIAIFVLHVYQSADDRAASVTIVCVLAVTSLLATVLLLPVDVALVSSTNSPLQGIKYDWATPDHVQKLTHSLHLLYYALYLLDAVLCLFLVPYTYFWHDEADVEEENGFVRSRFARATAAMKRTALFMIFIGVLAVIALCAPLARDIKNGEDIDFGYFKHLFDTDRWELSLSFILGLLMSFGTLLSAFYMAPGMALLPLAFFNYAPAPSDLTNTETNIARLEAERNELERYRDEHGAGLDRRSARRLTQLNKDIRTLWRDRNLHAGVRRPTSWFSRSWIALENFFRPIKLLIGCLFVVFSFLIWASILVTGIDKVKNSFCKSKCGYLLAHINIFQPMNWILVESSRFFPADYVIFFVLVLFLCMALVVGIFKVNKGPARPQPLLLVTGLMVMVVIAMNYTISTMIAPQYASFGSQTFCDRTPIPGLNPDCTSFPELVKPCTELSKNPFAQVACTPSVASTIINRVLVAFPIFGVLNLWGQFAMVLVYFLVIFVLVMCWSCCRRTDEVDDDDLEDDIQALLSEQARERRRRTYGTVSR